MNDSVLLESKNSIATITLNRPAQLNALNDDMMFGLKDVLGQVENDKAIRAVVLRGAGRAFMAGGDVAMFHARKDKVADEFMHLGSMFHESIKIMRRMKKPVLASVHGACAGGGLSVMLACDLAIAAQSSQFTLAYSRIGTSPDGGSTHFLPRIIGARKTLELAFLPDVFGANEALKLNMINWAIADDQLAAETERIATKLAKGPTRAFAHTKALVNASFDTTIEMQLDNEVTAFADCASGNDFKEGVTAFIEQRGAKFVGE